MFTSFCNQNGCSLRTPKAINCRNAVGQNYRTYKSATQQKFNSSNAVDNINPSSLYKYVLPL
jgi:hypothetical protein